MVIVEALTEVEVMLVVGVGVEEVMKMSNSEGSDSLK